MFAFFFFFSSRRRHTRFDCDWSSDVCSSDLNRSETFLLPLARRPGCGSQQLAPFYSDACVLSIFLKVSVDCYSGAIVVTIKISKPSLFVALTALMTVSVVRAQEMHRHDFSEELGQVNFPVTCTAAAQKQFNRAVAWLHSFEYEAAEKAFTEVTVTDPQCGIAYWGIAMSHYHPLWVPPTVAELKKGLSAI